MISFKTFNGLIPIIKEVEIMDMNDPHCMVRLSCQDPLLPLLVPLVGKLDG